MFTADQTYAAAERKAQPAFQKAIALEEDGDRAAGLGVTEDLSSSKRNLTSNLVQAIL